MSDAPKLDWQNDPALRAKRREVAKLLTEHAEALRRRDTPGASKVLTEVERILKELGIKSYSQLGL